MNWYKSIKPLPVSLKKLKERCRQEKIELDTTNPRVKKIIKELQKEQNQEGGMIL